MNKTIIIQDYPGSDLPEITIHYKSQQVNKIHHLACHVQLIKPKQPWLESYSFDFESLKRGKQYSLLYSNSRNSKNLATSLFMKLVYKTIMLQEKFKID